MFSSVLFSALTYSLIVAQGELELSLLCPNEGRREPSFTNTGRGVQIGHVLTPEDAEERLIDAFKSDSVNSIFIDTDGSYFLPSPVDGELQSVRVFGYVHDLLSVYFFNETSGLGVLSEALNKIPYLYVLVYGQNAERNTYSLIYGPEEVTYGFEPITHHISNVFIHKHDLIGVLIPGGGCILEGNLQYCSAQPNAEIDDGKCSSAFFHPMNNSATPRMDIPADEFYEVFVNLSMEAIVIPEGEEKIIVPVAVIGTLLFIAIVAVPLVLIFLRARCIKSKRTVLSGVSSNAYQSASSNDHTYETPVDAPPTDHKKYDLGLTAQDIALGYKMVDSSEVPNYSLNGSLKHDGTDKDAYEYDYANQEPYFEPANEEEELKMQLKTKLEVMEIPRESIELHEKLGSGAFGTVYRGEWSHSVEGSSDLVKEVVAVKTMDGELTEMDRVKFLQEAAIMAQFKHNYVITLKGILIEQPMMIVLDLMDGGDLRLYLRKTMRQNVKTLHSLESGSILLSYMRQIALGMHYFANKSFVHRDLAARNILMSGDGTTCKIADFGLSRDLHNENIYVSQGGKVPVKWTAPEALQYRKYSSASDVWSFGCVLYEIWSLGEKPFQEMTNQEAMGFVMAGNRLSPPPGCPRIVYSIMIKCWHPDSDERPTFGDIMQELQKSDFHIVKWSEEDIKTYSQKTRTLGAPLQLGKELYTDLQATYVKN